MLRRKQCWSDGAAQAGQDNVALDTSQSLPNRSLCHVRAHSLDDLDCLSSSAPLFQRDRQEGTSSPFNVLLRAAQTPLYPLLPCLSPEIRSSTPPGLPSFGTEEAERLRLMPLTHVERLARFLQQRLARTDISEQQDQQSQTTLRATQHNTTQVNRSSCDEPAEMLRRALGTTRPIAISVKPIQLRRSGLPKGVIRSAYPGVLAQADDRTNVRGRYAVRASGHGVGQRNMDLHPLARLNNSSEIDAAVREIDKACRERGSYDLDESVSNQELPLPRRRENTGPRTASTTAMAIAESLTAIQAIEREQRALKALRDSRRENMRLKTALKALQDSMPAAHASGHTQSGSHISDFLADRNRLETIIDNDSRPLRGDSEQTVEDVDPVNPTECPEMVEPMLYSSYSSYSYSPSNVAPLHFPSRARGTLPTMESMIERQTEEERRHATHEALNRYQVSEKSKCDHC